MDEQGYTNVWEYPGGIKEWMENGLPTEGKPEKV